MQFVERMRPLLGTFVRVRTRFPASSAPQTVERALASAFAAVERVHGLMSAHEDKSDVARINRAVPGARLTLDPWTWTVLRRAQDMFLATSGLFDCCIAPQLQDRGLLPRLAGESTPDPAARNCDLELLPGNGVCLRRPLHLTLDGIAKGYAVDRAVAVLRGAGAVAGTVDAGGDLRLFGSRAESVHVRHPADASHLIPLGRLREVAVATSAPYFVAPDANPYIDARSGRRCRTRASATVIARDCMTADALAKPLLIDPAAARSALERFGARGILLAPGRAAA